MSFFEYVLHQAQRRVASSLHRPGKKLTPLPPSRFTPLSQLADQFAGVRVGQSRAGKAAARPGPARPGPARPSCGAGHGKRRQPCMHRQPKSQCLFILWSAPSLSGSHSTEYRICRIRRTTFVSSIRVSYVDFRIFFSIVVYVLFESMNVRPPAVMGLLGRGRRQRVARVRFPTRDPAFEDVKLMTNRGHAAASSPVP